jgi:hypothetical protein
MVIGRCGDASAGMGEEVFRMRRLDAATPGLPDEGASQGMLAAEFRTRGKSEEAIPGDAALGQGDDGAKFRGAFREGARFVERQKISLR